MTNYYPSYKSFAQNFCQGHTLNGYCAKLASNLDAKVGLLTLSYSRQPQGGTRFLSIRGGPCQYLGYEILQQNHIWGL